MRVCPKCGYSDNPLWLACMFKRDIQMMRFEDFKENYPHLAEAVQKEKYLRDGQFLYHKTKQYVLRKEPSDFNQPFNENYEAHKSNHKRRLGKAGNLRQRELKTQTKLTASVSVRESG